MIRSLLLGSALLAIGWDGPTSDDLATYAAARLEAGRDADAHVRLALWSEARGFDDLKAEQLREAVAIKPDHSLARRLLGQITDGSGGWITPSQSVIEKKAQADRVDALARYELRREPIADTPQAHWQLANWCEQEGLKAEAQVHLRAVVKLDPTRDEAWKKLGARKQSGHWVMPDRQAVEKLEADVRKKADARWRPLLQKWKTWLTQNARKAEAEAALAGLTDPGAVGSIVKLFGSGNSDEQVMAVRLLGQVDAASATRALAWLAVHGSTDPVRRSAAESLKGRDPRECSSWLIGLLRDPIKFEVKEVGGPGSPGELYVEGKRVNNRSFYAAPTSVYDFQPGDTLAIDENGFLVARRTVGYTRMPLGATIDQLYQGAPDLTGAGSRLEGVGLGTEGMHLGRQMEQNQKNNVKLGNQVSQRGGLLNGSYNAPLQADIPVEQMARQAQLQAEASRLKLKQDVDVLKRYNSEVNQLNARVLLALKVISGENRDSTTEAWRKWWVELEETSTIAPPRTRMVDLDTSKPPMASEIGAKGRLPSLGKGTLVWTEMGLRAIEEIRAGDLVLTQDLTSGALAITPVWSTRRIDPALAHSVRFEGLTLVATEMERIWVAGRGWVPIGRLREGDKVRTLQGLARVEATDDAKVQPSYHIQVGDGRSIFVGTNGVMAHDDLVNNPVANPFDAEGGRVP